MNDDIITSANRLLYGALVSNLQSAWSRAAQHAVHEARRAPARPRPLRPLVAVAATLATALLAFGTIASSAPAMAAGAALPSHAPPLRAPGTQPMQGYADAVRAFRARQFACAYGRFSELADEGHRPSALMALMMVGAGPSMFDTEWSATAGQLQRWSAMVSADLRQRGAQIADHDRGE